MGDKEVKNKKGFMSRLSSFRKKKSSSKHGSASSLKSSSGENSGKGDSKRKMLSDVDRKSKTNSCVSSSQNSLEGLNGRTRSTSDLIAGFEKRLSQLRDEKVKTVAQPSKRSSETSSNSSLESERSLRVTTGVGTNADQNPASRTKGHLKTTAQSTVTSKSGIQPYRSVFNEGHDVLDNLEKTDDTTQTDFSQRSEGDDDVARLVKVQSTKTPETKRAHLSAARQNVDASGQGGGLNNKTIIIGKETFIGPDPSPPEEASMCPSLDFRARRLRCQRSPMSYWSRLIPL
ncbi:hypothetical protein BSL78_18353 [Apostichopus japonicus]|uniref:Uncharacterized protein n=1 Tax=Stichopus japonicus TaxID=307972 RepID=A0A2G8K9Z7_STIJA|nr:hypothetical protein BSL78_18353 [Apostichopus japonicus]